MNMERPSPPCHTCEVVHSVVVAAALQTGTTAKSMGADVSKAMEHLQVRGIPNPMRTNTYLQYFVRA